MCKFPELSGDTTPALYRKEKPDPATKEQLEFFRRAHNPEAYTLLWANSAGLLTPKKDSSDQPRKT